MQNSIKNNMKKLTIIAELGLNHNGNKDLIKEMIRQASFTGVDFVKLQLGWRGEKGEMNEIDNTDIENLYKYSELYNVKLLFSVFNKKSLDLLLPFKPQLIKIASRTLKNDLELVKEIHSLGIKTISSVGMIDFNKIPKLDKNLNTFLYCRSKYPTYHDDLTSFPINFNENKFIGYSDHCLGISACLLAISRGAKIIEKHFTLDKSDTTIRDHVLSSTPDEFEQLVRLGHEISTYSEIL